MSSSLLLTLALAPAGPFHSKPLPPVAVPADAPFGYAYAPARDLDKVPRYPARRYDPQPGDVILMSDPIPRSRLLYALALTGAPGHGGVVVRRPDGSLGLLEAGFNESLWTRVVPLDYRLSHYPGTVWVRRLCRPLSADQDAGLTAFACAADGTRYSVLGITVQLTPFSHRGLFRTSHLGRSRGPGRRFFCSEAILEALVAAGAVDPAVARPSATYPRDLFFDRALNPYVNRHPPLAGGWDPPALWTPILGVAARGRDRPPVAGVVVPPPPEPPTRPRRFRR
ncbi:MAG: hypothetical protein K2X87_32850 [Gemmataceae bacterium]|nr:hypothetical protein [Gemmataceae bacterium]